MLEPDVSLVVQLLGPPQVVRNEEAVPLPSGKGAALLAYLACRRGWVGRGELAALFWPEAPEKKARANLRWHLHRLRGEPWGEGLEAEAGRLRWRVPTDLQGLLEAAEREAWPAVLSRYRGTLLEGFECSGAPAFERWLELERARLFGLWRQASLEQAARLGAEGQHRAAAELLEAVLRRDPLDEEVVQRRLETARAETEREGALRSYRAFARRLAEELGLEPLAETVRLAEALRHAGAAEASAGEAAAAGAALPQPATPLVGRRLERARLSSLLADPGCRLLTLSGPGGVGKTRLALQAAADWQAAAGEACFVPLAPLGSPEDLVPAVMAALGLPAGEWPRRQLLAALRPKRLLLVMDNFEHLLAGAGLIAEVLAAAPQVKVLVTSRERLNLPGEWLVEVEGLSSDAAEDDAAQLFAQSARRVSRTFRLDAATAPQVRRICRLVEGLPLGIELAAAWTRLLSCQEIADELERSLDLLGAAEAGARGVPARQRSLRAAFEHSWSSLGAEERLALGRLAIFRGGFDRAAASAVADASLPTLLGLLDKSLLRRPLPGRFEMLEVIRQHALEKLEPLERAALEEAHGDHYAAFLARREAQLEQRHPKAALAEIAAELENVRAAWRHAALCGAAPRLARALKALSTFYDLKGLFAEGARAFEQAVRGLEARAPEGAGATLLASLLLRQSWFAFRLGNYAEVRALLGRALAIFRAHGERQQVASCLYQLGNVAEALGDYDEARRRLGESLAAYREAGNEAGTARALNTLGLVACALGDYGEARRLHREGLSLRRRLGDPRGLVIGYNNLGDATLHLGARAEAYRLYRRALAMSEEIGDTWGVALSLTHLGDVARACGDDSAAEAHYRKGAALCQEIGHRYALLMAQRGLADVLAARGERAEARRLLRASLRAAVEVRAEPQALETLSSLARLEWLEGHPGESLELTAFVLAQPGGRRHTRLRAEGLLGKLRASLAEREVSAALERARAQGLEEVARDLLALGALAPAS